MTLTIGTWTYSGNLYTAQPFGYDESDTKAGRTARKLQLSALMTAAEWGTLLTTYNTWRDTRITDADSATSNSVGTTVAVTAAANGVSWAAVPCWFLSAPSGEQVGTYIQATVEVVDAAQALEVLQAERVSSSAKYYFGTYTIGTTTLNLLRPPETYQDMPQMTLTAGGTSYINGPLTATRVRAVEGDTDAAGWAAIQAWVESTVQAVPTAGDWFPLGAPSATAEAQIVGGVRSDVYTVSITLGQAK
jgi:hypothetical protein